MAKIRTVSVRGNFDRIEYEIHYSAKDKVFEAKKLPDFFAYLIQANNENELEAKVKAALLKIEESQQGWRKYIIYRFIHRNESGSRIGSTSWSGDFKTTKGLGIDWTIIYLNDVGGNTFYCEQLEYERCIKNKTIPPARNIKYGGYSGSGLDTIEHSEDLEAFFTSVMNGLSNLIELVKEKLSTKESILLLATNNQKLIG